MGIGHVFGARMRWAEFGCSLAGLATVTAVAIAWASAPAMAQSADTADRNPANQKLEEVTVTAQRRTERASDVPISIATVDTEQLVAADVQNLPDLPKVTPGLRFDSQGAYIQPTIRGVGADVVQVGQSSNIGIYVDGYYEPNPLALDFSFLNVENVQVLKGPQGTLFGRNTTGGAILVNSAEPSTDTRAIVEASYGRYNAQKYQTYLTTGLADNIAVSVEGMYASGNGFQENIYDGSLSDGGGFAPGAKVHNPGAYENWSVRTGLKVNFSANNYFLLRYAHSDTNDPTYYVTSAYKNNGIAYSGGAAIPGTVIATDFGQTANNARTEFDEKTDTVQLTGKFDIGFADLTSYSQWRREQMIQFFDEDHSAATVFALGLPEDDRILSQELLLTSKPGSPLQYTGGLFFFDQQTTNFVQYNVFAPPTYAPINALATYDVTGVDTRTEAGYLDATYEVLHNLFLTGGVRFSHDEINDPHFTRGAPTSVTDPSYRKNKVTPRFVIRYKPNEDSSVYASFTQGYKSSVFDVTSAESNLKNIFLKPEDITAYEVGYKYSKHGFSADAAAFFYDYKNLQNAYYLTGVAILSNAAQSRIKGLDGQVAYDFGYGFEVSAAATYLDAKYTDYPNSGYFVANFTPGGAFTHYTSTNVDVSGFQMQRAPTVSGSLAAKYSTQLAGGELATSANLYLTSKVYLDSSHEFSQGGYGILAMRIGWTDPSDRYTVAIYGDNLTDKRYYAQINPTSFGTGAIWGMPLTYGVSLRVKL